ncbi:MAG: DUF1232 domain-containing protein [Sphingobacteriales bacterium]|jgi:uncharacterized membrane protein YkvA (DUF1232 family)|nr:MAG: DUF1232 domain-containing protein [Sphingobacteriales bacterium]
MNTIIDKLIKEAESIIASDGKISQLIDAFFLKLGETSEKFYLLQDNLIALGRMLKAWFDGEYKNISTTSIIAVVAAMVYFVNPLDLIPDFIPIIGQIDDMLILGYLIKILNKEIEKFMAWEQERAV